MHRKHLIKPITVCVIICLIAVACFLSGCLHYERLKKGVYVGQYVLEVSEECKGAEGYYRPIGEIDYICVKDGSYHPQDVILAKEWNHLIRRRTGLSQPANHVIK